MGCIQQNSQPNRNDKNPNPNPNPNPTPIAKMTLSELIQNPSKKKSYLLSQFTQKNIINQNEIIQIELCKDYIIGKLTNSKELIIINRTNMQEYLLENEQQLLKTLKQEIDKVLQKN